MLTNHGKKKFQNMKIKYSLICKKNIISLNKNVTVF